MPLKVSSQGWVKVAPPPRPRKRRVDPEEQKEALCSPLRYFACQGVDVNRQRLQMLGGREGFSSSQVDLIRPQSRIERSSTLDEWRWDTHQSRSSSRMSGTYMESSSPPKHHVQNDFEPSKDRTGRTSRHSEHSSDGQGAEGRSSRMSGNDNGSRISHGKERHRSSSAPVVTPISPPASVYDDADSHVEAAVEVDFYPDHVSVAYTETPSEKYCKHHHRHRKDRKLPTAIPEEEESEPNVLPIIPAAAASSYTKFDSCSRQHVDDGIPSHGSVHVPEPTIARSVKHRSCKTEIEIPSPILESTSAGVPDPISASTRSEKASRSERSEDLAGVKRPEKKDFSARSETSSQSSYSSRSSSYRSRRTESESSYSASERSASPIRDDRYRSRNHSSRHKDNDTESYHPSPPPSPRLSARKPRHEPRSSEIGIGTQRDRVATAPASTSYSKYKPAPSTSTWTSSSSSISSRSSAPSINGYQLQAAIFQPKNCKGYRAPSLSKGNRWETATSALSFD